MMFQLKKLTTPRIVALIPLLFLLTFMNTSCASFGGKKLVSSHMAYNDAVQLTVTREVLANIVRSRYTDPMQFLAVQAINAQFSVNVGGGAGVGGLGQAGAVGEVSGSVGYSDSPTITYVPQSGAAFHKSVLSPMEIEDVIGFAFAGRLMQTEPDWRRPVLRLSFASINGATEIVSGRRSELYYQRVEAMERLLLAGAYVRQVPEWDFNTAAIAREKVTGEDQVKAFAKGLYFVEEDDGHNLRLARYRLVVALVLPDPEDPEIREALENLGVKPGRAQYILRPPTHSSPGPLDPYAIWVTPRSIADLLIIAGQFVDVPAAHAKIVPPIKRTLESPVRILSSEQEPPFPYRVQHRGYWFYVEDSDLMSREFLEVMVGVYTSRIGSKQAEDAAPQLVLPVGGN